MTVQTAAGCKLSISDAASTAANQTAFEAETFIEVGEISDLGEFGAEFSTITHTSLSDRIVRKFKGTEDPGSLQLQLGYDPDDTGQAECKTALASDNEWAFKVELNDSAGVSPTTFYFRGRVMSFKRQPGGPESIVTAQCNIGINTRPIEVAAA